MELTRLIPIPARGRGERGDTGIVTTSPLTSIGTTFIEDATPEDARRAFLRICKAGVPMSEADFNSAMKWDPGHSDEEGDAPAERPAFR